MAADDELSRDVVEALRRLGRALGSLARDLERADVKAGFSLHDVVGELARIEGRIDGRLQASLRHQLDSARQEPARRLPPPEED